MVSVIMHMLLKEIRSVSQLMIELAFIFSNFTTKINFCEITVIVTERHIQCHYTYISIRSVCYEVFVFYMETI